MSMETPLRRVLGLGSAKSGTGHFWHQRVTGLANLFLIGFLLAFITRHLGGSWEHMVECFHNPFIAVFMMLSFTSILWHMKLGLQVVIEDYVHSKPLLFLCLIANSAYCVSLGAFALYAVAHLSLGV